MRGGRERGGQREAEKSGRKERERKMGGMGWGERGGTRSLPRAGFKSSLSPVSPGPGGGGGEEGSDFSPPAGASANFDDMAAVARAVKGRRRGPLPGRCLPSLHPHPSR